MSPYTCKPLSNDLHCIVFITFTLSAFFAEKKLHYFEIWLKKNRFRSQDVHQRGRHTDKHQMRLYFRVKSVRDPSFSDPSFSDRQTAAGSVRRRGVFRAGRSPVEASAAAGVDDCKASDRDATARRRSLPIHHVVSRARPRHKRLLNEPVHGPDRGLSGRPATWTSLNRAGRRALPAAARPGRPGRRADRYYAAGVIVPNSI